MPPTGEFRPLRPLLLRTSPYNRASFCRSEAETQQSGNGPEQANGQWAAGGVRPLRKAADGGHTLPLRPVRLGRAARAHPTLFGWAAEVGRGADPSRLGGIRG